VHCSAAPSARLPSLLALLTPPSPNSAQSCSLLGSALSVEGALAGHVFLVRPPFSFCTSSLPAPGAALELSAEAALFPSPPAPSDMALINSTYLSGFTSIDTLAAVGEGQNMLVVDPGHEHLGLGGIGLDNGGVLEAEWDGEWRATDQAAI
jgi:hypothetical protein